MKFSQPSHTVRINLRDLRPGDVFLTPDSRGTVYRAESVSTMDNMTRVAYTIPGSTQPASVFAKVNLSTVYVLTD